MTVYWITEFYRWKSLLLLTLSAQPVNKTFLFQMISAHKFHIQPFRDQTIFQYFRLGF